MSRKARTWSSSYSIWAGTWRATIWQKRQVATPPASGRTPLASRLRPDLDEHPHDVGIELAAAHPLQQDPEGLRLLEGWLVGAPRPQGVVDVHHRHDAGQVGDLFADQLVGVAVAVDPLVVVADERPDQRQR